MVVVLTTVVVAVPTKGHEVIPFTGVHEPAVVVTVVTPPEGHLVGPAVTVEVTVSADGQVNAPQPPADEDDEAESRPKRGLP